MRRPAELPPIAAARVTPVRAPLHVPFAISRETLAEADVALVELTDEVGATGLGEAASFPSLTGDTPEAALQTAGAIAESCVGLRAWEALAGLRAERAALAAGSLPGFVGVETALWDLYARQLGVPLAALWGGGVLAEVETDVTLPALPPEAVPAFWARYGGHGFATIKVKVVGDVDADVARVRAIARLAGPGARLTLDGNQGYREPDALRLADELAKVGIRPAFFEQPLAEGDWAGHARLSARLPFPVCLDETVRTAADALRAAQERAGAVLNLKIMKSGIEETLRIAQVARAAGLELMIGGMLESEVAMGASLQIAAGLGFIQHFDLDTPFFFAAPVAAGSPWRAGSARLAVPAGPGHGMTRLV